MEEQKAQKEDRFLRGRHISFMRVTGAHEIILEFPDLIGKFLLGDDVLGF